MKNYLNNSLVLLICLLLFQQSMKAQNEKIEMKIDSIITLLP